MAPRVSKTASGVDVPAQMPGQISLDEFWESLDHVTEREDLDWSAMQQLDLGALVLAILKADAGVMLRSSDRGRAVSVGIFVGGRSKWQTCVDQRELLAILNECSSKLEDLAFVAQAPRPTRKAQRRS